MSDLDDTCFRLTTSAMLFCKIFTAESNFSSRSMIFDISVLSINFLYTEEEEQALKLAIGQSWV